MFVHQLDVRVVTLDEERTHDSAVKNRLDFSGQQYLEKHRFLQGFYEFGLRNLKQRSIVLDKKIVQSTLFDSVMRSFKHENIM